MTNLRDKIKERIRVGGPITVAEYMSLCLADPKLGYYASREPFGTEGDFITAPEVSQLFGEMVGAACLSAWEALCSPSTFELVEFGPGRGTLMADILRVAHLRPDFLKAANLSLIETSPRLREIQAETLKNAPVKPKFGKSLSDVQENPIIIVANEFFDALPIHQFVKTNEGWRERVVGLSSLGELAFGVGTSILQHETIPKSAQTAPNGAILETQPAANGVATEMGSRITAHGGAALLIDYGYLSSQPGDTLQALYKHTYDDVLAHPGSADLTAHVNFEALAHALKQAGAAPLPPLTQGDFLLRSGLLERAGALGANKSYEEQEEIRDAVERLAAPNQMGDLFKVLAVTNNGLCFQPFDKLA